MKVFRRLLLVSLLCVGGFSTFVVTTQAFPITGIVSEVINLGTKYLPKLFNKAKGAQVEFDVSQIKTYTNDIKGGINDLKTVSSGMQDNLYSLYNDTRKFYDDLKKVSRGVQQFQGILDMVGNTRDVYGYCGAAMTLAGRSRYLTLQEYEYAIRNVVEIQGYVLNKLEKTITIITSSNVKMNDFERMQMFIQLAEEQARAVRAAKQLVARIKGLELRHQLKARDDAFRRSFLNMTL